MKKKERTDEQIKNSLLDLMSEKNILRITVGEVCERAYISRSTFYTHYESIDELIKTIESQLICEISALAEKFVNNESVEDKIQVNSPDEFFSYLHKNRDAVLSFISPNGDPYFVIKIKQIIADTFAKVLNENNLTFGACEADLLSCFSAGATDNLYKWLQYGGQTDKEIAEAVKAFFSNTLMFAKPK